MCEGRVAPPFEGEVYVRSNDWRFFLGDTFWPPLEDKQGTWTLTIRLNGQTIATKQFTAVKDDAEAVD